MTIDRCARRKSGVSKVEEENLASLWLIQAGLTNTNRAGWHRVEGLQRTEIYYVKVDEVVAEGDRVVVRTTLSGLHQGEIQRIPATGRTVSISSITIFRLANGKIAEGWLVQEQLVLMPQLGVSPAPQAG
jgi:hypothetical protein